MQIYFLKQNSNHVDLQEENLHIFDCKIVIFQSSVPICYKMAILWAQPGTNAPCETSDYFSKTLFFCRLAFFHFSLPITNKRAIIRKTCPCDAFWLLFSFFPRAADMLKTSSKRAPNSKNTNPEGGNRSLLSGYFYIFRHSLLFILLIFLILSALFWTLSKHVLIILWALSWPFCIFSKHV